MIQIKQKNSGKVLLRVNAPSLEGVDFSHRSLRRAGLPGANLAGADLRGADLREAELGAPGRALGRVALRLGLVWLSVVLIFGQVVIPYVIPALQNNEWLQWLLPFLHPIAWFYATTLLCVVRLFQALGRCGRALWRPVNLQRAHLQGADLSGAALNGANLTGARYDASTRWPNGFDPVEHGAIPEGGVGEAAPERLPASKSPYRILACAILAVVAATGAAAFHMAHQFPPPPDVEALLPADGTVVDVMQPVAPPRLRELTGKLQRAVQKQPEWWLAEIRKAKPGEPLPYDPRLGLTRAEYKELLHLMGALTVKKAGTAQLRVTRKGKHILFDGGEPLPDLNGVELDETTGALTTPYGTTTHWTRITASPEQKATGPWSGIEWEIEQANQHMDLGTVVKFALGRLRTSGRGLLRYDVQQVTEQSRTDFSHLLEYDLQAKSSGQAPSGTVAHRQRSHRQPSRWLITSESAGPFDISMSETEVRRAAARLGLRVQPARTLPQDESTPSLVVLEGDKPLMSIGFEPGHHGFIKVTSPRFATAEGAHVSMQVRRLGRLYGRGVIYQGPYSGGRLVVEFNGERTFGLDFTLENTRLLTLKSKGPDNIARSRADWQRLMHANPRITAVNVSGE